ncbi:hypothetical protein SeLEV6574_g05708 [Synchytrium endobioticum]|uniref:Uncharacterized protein n=1 Tax=Synchytrium endobioticum TaxID=286115 RepID=A0A507CSY5_9FUNG|nr:hypothetical protein SeLEV6574_g05708 [Synchytrium endobioticum]
MTRAIALYQCTGDDPTELSFHQKAVILDVSEAEDPGWYRGRLEGSSGFGIFPGNYVTFVEDITSGSSTTHSSLEPDTTSMIPARGPPRLVGVEGLPGPNLLSAKLQPVDAARPMSSVIVTKPDMAPASKPVTSSPSLPFSLPKMSSVSLVDHKPESTLSDWTRNASAPRKPKIDALATRKALREKSNTLAAIARENMTAVARGSGGSNNISTSHAGGSIRSSSSSTITPGSSVSNIAPSFSGTTPITFTGARSFSAGVSSTSKNTTFKSGGGGGSTHSLSLSSSSSALQNSYSSPLVAPRHIATESDPDADIIMPKSVMEAAKAFEKAASHSTKSATPKSSVLFNGVSASAGPVKKHSSPKDDAAASAAQGTPLPSISTRPSLLRSSTNTPSTPVSASSASSYSTALSAVSSFSSVHITTPTAPLEPSGSTSTIAADGKRHASAAPPARPSKPIELRSARPTTVGGNGHVHAATNGKSGNKASRAVPDCIPTDARVRYEDVFNRYDANHEGFLSGDEVRTIWMRSGLDPPTLGEIWALADVDEDGSLTKEEFCIGMFLIDDRLRGIHMPDQLPQGLINYAKVRT